MELNVTLIFVHIGGNPTIGLLMKYIDDVAPYWYNLGTQLLQKHAHMLNVIEANNLNDVQKSCVKMFQHWLDVDVQANWKKLIDALECIQMNVLAEKIRQDNLIGKFY